MEISCCRHPFGLVLAILCWRRRQIDPGCRFPLTQIETCEIVTASGFAGLRSRSVDVGWLGQKLIGTNILQLIPGIGPATAAKILDLMQEAADPTRSLNAFQAPSSAAGEWQSFVQLYAALRNPNLAWPADINLARDWYLTQLDRIHDDAQVRAADVEQLAQLASGYASRERFLTEITLDPPAATSDRAGPPLLDEDYLILSTIHSAKGQE